MKSTKKALVLSLLSLVVCASLLVGTTFAWFTDSVTSANNIIKSGNLDVELYYADEVTADANGNDTTAWTKVDENTDIFGYNLWEPGYTKVAYFKVVNEGSLALKYKLSADVYEETAGVNQEGKEFLLSDYIKTAVVDVDATRDEILAMAGTDLKASFAVGADHLTANTSKVVGLALWMPTTVGNEANHNGTVPSITFGINLIATQDTVEGDSFGTDYDVNAVYPNIDFPSIVTGNVNVVAGQTQPYEIDLFSSDINLDTGLYSSQGSVKVPAGAVDPNATQIEAVIKTLEEVDTSVTVGAGEKATTLDITVEGIKENNTEVIEVTANIGKNLANVKVYHKNVPLTLGSEYYYNPVDGVLKIYTTSFSPFTVVYDADEVYVAPEIEIIDPNSPEYVEGLPTANVTKYTDTTNIEWGNYGQWSPTEGLEANLEAAYTFVCDETADQAALNKFANWYCDFYVMLDKDLGENEIFLGGNYGSFGWVGFHNGDVTLKANEEIGLLESVTTNPWTYADVAQNVGTFICGVGDVNDALSGATFTVMLRLTDPADATHYINVATINYKF